YLNLPSERHIHTHTHTYIYTLSQLLHHLHHDRRDSLILDTSTTPHTSTQFKSYLHIPHYGSTRKSQTSRFLQLLLPRRAKPFILFFFCIIIEGIKQNF
ncbi:uncharacterized protein SEPMUDRAFT_145693, partial [Sphaerulina musiva SO2202]